MVSFLSFDCYAEQQNYCCELRDTTNANRLQPEADNLAKIDSEGIPAYLESSNPDNDPRYERLGFVRAGEFERPDGRLTCSTMWREPR